MADISVEEAEAMVIEAAKELNEAQQLENTKLEELNARKFGARFFKRQEYKEYSNAVRERNKAQNRFDELYAELLNKVYDERQTIRKDGLARAKEASERLSKIEDEIKAAESEGNNDRLEELNIELVEAQGDLSIANARVALNQAEYMYTRAKYDKFSIPAAAFEETPRVQGAQRLVEYRQEELQKAEEAAQKAISEARVEDSKVIETEEQIETSVDESSGVLYDRIEAARANVIRFREQVAAIQENMSNNQGPMRKVAQEALKQATNQLIRAENDYKQLTGKDFDDVEEQVSQDEPAATAAEEPSFEEANGGSVEEAQAKVSDANQRLREIRERIRIARNEGDSVRLGALNLEYIEARGNLLIANAEKNLAIAENDLAEKQLETDERSVAMMEAMLYVRKAELEFAKASADNRMKAFRADKLGTEEARNDAVEAGKREEDARLVINLTRTSANSIKNIIENAKATRESLAANSLPDLSKRQENNREIPEDTSEGQLAQMREREENGPTKVGNPEVQAPEVEEPEVENPEIKAKKAELARAKKIYVEALKGVGQAKRDLEQAEKELVEFKSNLEHNRGKPYAEDQSIWTEEIKQEFQNANNKIEVAKEKIENAKKIVGSSKDVLDQIGLELAILRGLNLKPSVAQKGTPSFLKNRVDTTVGEGNAKNTDEPGNTPSSENESKNQKQEEGPEVPPFMDNRRNTTTRRNENAKRGNRVTPIKPKRQRDGEAGEPLDPNDLGKGEEPVSNSNQVENRESGENGQSQAPREMSEKSKEKIAMLTNLRRALTQLDVAAQTAIQMVIDRAEVAKNDPNETLKVSDVSALKEVLAKMDEIVYSPEVANAAADASQAYQMNILIGNLRRKIQKNIQKSIVENYHDLNIENDLTYFYNGNNPNDPARNGSSMNVEGFFGDFVKRNLDNSRLRYEEMQLRTMKRGLAYAKTANNPQYEGFGHVFGELNNACVDKANIDLVFQKAAEYTPEKIQSMMDALQTQQFSPEQIEEVFKAVSEYTKALEDIEKSFKENSQLVGEKRKVIEEIINGNNEFDKNVAPELQGVVRALAFQTLYAHTLDDYEGVKGRMLKSLDNHGKTDFSTMMKMLGNVKKFNSSPNRAEILARQRDKALLGKILFDIPFLKESVGQVVPGFHTALHQFEMSDEAPEPVDNLYAWLAMTVKQYQDGRFNQKIADLEAYAIGYEKANQNASRLSPDGTRPLNGDELFDAMIKEQEDAVKREKDLIERKEKYIERSDKIKGEGVEQSSSELDIEKLGKKLGVDNLKGKVALPSNQENESGSNNQTVRTALQEQQILNELSEANYLALRINAIAELNKKNPQALIPRGLLIKRFAIFLVNSIGRMLGVRNIPTKSEKAINQYIKNNYISEMLKENDRIQSELSAVKAEEEAIKSEEISLKDRNRKKISERDKLLNKEKAKDKGAQTKAAPSQGEPSK